jgi:hypothetical protein
LLKDALPEGFPCISNIPTTETNIESVIYSLKSRDPSGYDEKMSDIFKSPLSVINRPPSHICNHSLHTGIFPDHLKMSIINPLHKEGGKASMKN